MKKKNPLISIIAPLGAIAVILIIVFAIRPTGSGPLSGGMTSEDGTAEAQAYVDALAAGNWAEAAQYVQEGCVEDCLFEEASATEIATYLEEACAANYYCGPSQLAEPDEVVDNKRTHTFQAVNDEGAMQRLCLDEACGLQKSKYIISTFNADGVWYVTGLPATYTGFPQ